MIIRRSEHLPQRAFDLLGYEEQVNQAKDARKV